MDGDWTHAAGRALRGFRAGFEGLASRRRGFVQAPEALLVSSPAFGSGHDMPERYTADGEGLSPPLAWQGEPAATLSLVLLVEDADIPLLPRPAVHAIVHGIRPGLGGLAEGAIPSRLRGPSPEGFFIGRNFRGRPGWTPPAPPLGHGPHHYVFQLFALDAVPRFDWAPGRGYLLQRIRPHVIARGELCGVYERG
jgi:Raf kinase inhibitor-like YbhB/YbcL family protein